jgi:hypothetical protein
MELSVVSSSHPKQNLIKMNKLITFALVLGTVVAVVKFPQIAIAGSPQYKITTVFAVDRSGDGLLDNTLEAYGAVRINGVVINSISRNNAIDRTAGQWGPNFMEVQTVIKGSTATIDAVLMDRDTISSDDIVFQMSPTVIDLEATANAPYYGKKRIKFTSPSGDEGATLYISVSKMPCMFTAAGCN